MQRSRRPTRSGSTTEPPTAPRTVPPATGASMRASTPTSTSPATTPDAGRGTALRSRPSSTSRLRHSLLWHPPHRDARRGARVPESEARLIRVAAEAQRWLAFAGERSRMRPETILAKDHPVGMLLRPERRVELRRAVEARRRPRAPAHALGARPGRLRGLRAPRGRYDRGTASSCGAGTRSSGRCSPSTSRGYARSSRSASRST